MEIKRPDSRLFEMETYNRKKIETPFFFPSISSIKTNYNIKEYLDLIEKTSYPSFLVSACDLFHSDNNEQDLIKDINELTESTNTMSLLDCGHYEAYWYKDENWDFDKFKSILEKITVDFSFSFDEFWDENKNFEEHFKGTKTNIAKTAGSQSIGTTIPLVHGNPENHPKLVKKIVMEMNAEIIAIPERELGASLFERMETIKNIRKELDKTNRDVPLHLLGTGNPRSIILYTLAGADMYDALEWCKNVVDPETGCLYHFVQKDLIDCKCSACMIDDIEYHIQTITHNLLFYQNLLEEIKNLISNNKIDELLHKYFQDKNIKNIKKRL